VLGDNQPVYLAQKFTPEEVRQINEAKGISQSSASSSHHYFQQKPDNNAVSPSQNDSSGKGGIFAIIGVVSILLIASVVLVKK